MNKHFTINILSLLSIVFAMAIPISTNAATYLDGATIGCSNGNTNYNPSTRSCSGGNDTVYFDLATFSANLAPSATNYIRAGSYFRDNSTGSLYVGSAKAGTADRYTIIRAYPGEERQAIIGTAKRGATYNSNPTDSTGAGSWNYYPNVAIRVEAPYVMIEGIKTYGPLETNGATKIQIRDCDLGGGGLSQCAVIRLENLTDALVFNNLIHNSCLASDGASNGPGIIFYNANAVVSQNTFYDNYSADVFTKDSGSGAAGKTTEISFNFFKPSTIRAESNPGVMGHNQDVQIAQLLIHHNIFLGKLSGFAVWLTPPATKFYNNTLVNCGTDIDNSSGGGAHPVISNNNLFYHSTSQNFALLYTETYSDYLKESDNNLFFADGSKWGKSAPGALTWAINLSDWKSRSNLDIKSITANPSFVNASGKTPEDFKRTSYVESFTNSSYSTRAGAYETGKETIGFTTTVGSSGVTPPSGVRVIK